MSLELLLYLLAMWPAFDLIAAGSFHDNSSVPVTQRAYNKVAGVKSISKRQASACRQTTQYWSNGICCNSCEPGSFAKIIGCTNVNSSTLCTNCTEGKEYMDHYNHLNKCLRCRTCDAVHGLEVESPCTITQNEKCRCMPGFFTSSSRPYDHCYPCDKCENGIIVKDCTQTENTKCGDHSRPSWLISTIALSVVALLIIVVILIYFRKKQKTKNQIGNDTTQQIIEMELLYPDIDLSPSIPDIAQEMRLQDISLLVLKLGVPHNRIEEITYDNPHNAYEQKIKLLEDWYQKNGRTDAYRTLMTTMRKHGLRATAEKLEGKIGADKRQSED